MIGMTHEPTITHVYSTRVHTMMMMILPYLNLEHVWDIFAFTFETGYTLHIYEKMVNMLSQSHSVTVIILLLETPYPFVGWSFHVFYPQRDNGA